MSIFSWYRLPRIFGLLRLNTFRDRMRERNLHDTETLPSIQREPLPPPTSQQLCVRTTEGTYNDLNYTRMGAAGMRFGRNVPLDKTIPDETALMTPSPRVVSRELMTRDKFIPATSLNLLAAAWLQFEVHDWFSHGKNEEANPHVVPLPANDDWPKSQMLINRTRHDPTRIATGVSETDRRPSYQNTETHWWDGSQIYGSDAATERRVRSGEHGKLKIGDDGLLPVDESGIDVTGVNGNWWIGLSMLHTLFTLEHNAICDSLRQDYPSWTDDELFQHARLINAAIMAKIHTVEWTTAILAHPTVQAGMHDNWSRIRRSKAEHHAAPFSMTEEFVAVYRMHPLMPDDFIFRSLGDGRVILERTLETVANRHAREVMNQVSLTDLFYSFGVAHPGAITLHNYPRHLQNLKLNGDVKMDLAAVDILRDRERGVPRYNEFRRLVGMEPIKKFEDLSDNTDWCEQIQRVYGYDIEAVDLMVGMFAEPLIKGFGFSETAFRIFLLMASRRLQSDRFFTTDYNKQTYTQTGLNWIEQTNMRTVLTRHLPQLQPILSKVENAFAPWPGS